MAASTPAKEEVTFGGAKAVVWPRGDGRWAVSWSQGGRGKSSTRKLKEDALKKARKVVRDLAAGLGSRSVSIEESEILQVLYRVCGDRSPVALLHEVEDALKSLKGIPLRKVVAHWKATGMSEVERATMTVAVNRFLDLYDGSPWETRGSLRKELRNFIVKHGEMDVGELQQEPLLAWIERDSPGPRFRNNRHATWRTFLNRCREWKYLPRGEKTVAELIKKVKEPKLANPPIFSVNEATKILALLWKEAPRKVPAFVLGCWFGLRPLRELRKVQWEWFDWERGYLHMPVEAVTKTGQERYVPIPRNARAMLMRWSKEHGAGNVTKEKGLVCEWHDRENISRLARAGKVIEVWTQDVMRHSSISYMLATGKGYSEIAEAHGNSEKVIRSNYRRPLRKEDGEAWYKVALP